MPKRDFTKHVFSDRPDTAIEMDVGEGWLPMTPKKAEELLKKSKEIAIQLGKDVTITLWVEHEDGTQQQLRFG